MDTPGIPGRASSSSLASSGPSDGKGRTRSVRLSEAWAAGGDTAGSGSASPADCGPRQDSQRPWRSAGITGLVWQAGQTLGPRDDIVLASSRLVEEKWERFSRFSPIYTQVETEARPPTGGRGFFSAGLVRDSSPKNENSLIIYSPLYRWKGGSPKNTSGVSGVNFVGAESDTFEVNGESFFRRNKTTEQNTTCLHTARVVSSKCLEALTIISDSVIYTVF